MRLKYKKGRRLCYISHLDTLRTFIRACRRAKLPLAYSQGFNPHPLISFLMPLSLGFTSECEYVDIGLEGEISAGEVIARLNAALPDGFLVVSGGAPHDKPGDITSAVYKITFSGKLVKDAARPAGGTECFIDGIKRFFAQNEIVAPKKSKRGVKEVDIRPMILDWELDGPLSEAGAAPENGGLALTLRLAAGSIENLNPTLVLTQLEGFLGEEITYHVCREKIFCGDREFA